MILLSVSGATVGARASDLYVLETDESSGSGKPLRMRFEEIEHAPRYSIVQVTHDSGASVPSVMFIVRGMWEMARQRGASFFIKLSERTTPEDKWLYKVGFADNDQIDVHSYFGESPTDPKFLSVRQYDSIFSH